MEETHLEQKIDVDVTRKIRARIVPFEGELNSLDATDIEQMDPTVLITIDKGRAIVRGSFSHCGLRNSLSGRYKRLKKK